MPAEVVLIGDGEGFGPLEDGFAQLVAAHLGDEWRLEVRFDPALDHLVLSMGVKLNSAYAVSQATSAWGEALATAIASELHSEIKTAAWRLSQGWPSK